VGWLACSSRFWQHPIPLGVFVESRFTYTPSHPEDGRWPYLRNPGNTANIHTSYRSTTESTLAKTMFANRGGNGWAHLYRLQIPPHWLSLSLSPLLCGASIHFHTDTQNLPQFYLGHCPLASFIHGEDAIIHQPLLNCGSRQILQFHARDRRGSRGTMNIGFAPHRRFDIHGKT
jgi:hypothetical protein